jgi:hypothetical protein
VKDLGPDCVAIELAHRARDAAKAKIAINPAICIS